MDLKEIKERIKPRNTEYGTVIHMLTLEEGAWLIAEVERLAVNNELYQQQNEMNAQQYTGCCEVNRRQFEALSQVEKERDRYKAALEEIDGLYPTTNAPGILLARGIARTALRK